MSEFIDKSKLIDYIDTKTKDIIYPLEMRFALKKLRVKILQGKFDICEYEERTLEDWIDGEYPRD